MKGGARTSPKSSSKRNIQRRTPVFIKPDHSVVVTHIQRFSTNNIGGGFFDSYEVIGPHNILNNSSWKYLLDIYESVRVTRIDMKCYMYGVSINTPGITAAMCFRDIVTQTPNRVYEQLAVEPGHKRGRPVKTYHFQWVPIEPSDYEFYDHTQFAQMDSGRYGQLNYAGSGFPNDIPKPIIEFKVKYDFKSLVRPVEAVSRLNNNDDDFEVAVFERPNSSYSASSRPVTAQRPAVYCRQ